MMLTTVATMGVYYLLDAKTELPESLSISGSIGVAVFGALATTKLIKKD